MSNTKEFFHDRFVLFLLTVNSFLVIVNVASILLRIGGGSDRYIQAYRSNLGLSSVTVGGVSEILAFLVFAVGIFAAHIFLSLQFHKIRKTVAWVVLLMTTLLLLLSLIVVNTLLGAR